MNKYKIVIKGYKPAILWADHAVEALYKWCGLSVFGAHKRIEHPYVTWLTIDADTYGVKWALGYVQNEGSKKVHRFEVDMVEDPNSPKQDRSQEAGKTSMFYDKPIV